MECGPCDEEGKKQSASVGISWNDKVKVIKEVIKTEQLKEAWAVGRVEKYVVALGWKGNARIYVIYGKSWGTKEAYVVTETIMEAIE